MISLAKSYAFYFITQAFNLIFFPHIVLIYILQSLASDKISEAEAVAAMYRNTTPTLLDVTQSEEKLNKLIQQHDVVIR